MFHPLTVGDFLERAASVYPELVGSVDEIDCQQAYVLGQDAGAIRASSAEPAAWAGGENVTLMGRNN